jgi:ParB family chromosome partitioning protein
MTDNRIYNEDTTMVQVDPATLLVDRNVRHNALLSREFLASVADLGVLVPIVAVRTPGGELRVRYGHRRTLAAVEAGHAYVPVVVVADERSDDGGEVERLVTQYAENEHRSGLTTSERVEVFTQLSAFGVSASEIAKRTKTKRREVKAALSVGASELARAATARYDFLNLEQAAMVADFEDDAEAVKALVLAARNGGFDHLAQRLRDDRAERAVTDAEAERLADQGVTVIEPPGWSEPGTELDHLMDSNGRALDPEGHRACPGHAAYVVTSYGEDEHYDAWPCYVCCDPDAHGHRSKWAAPARAAVKADSASEEAARQERRRVLANNKAWRSAEAVRREWLVRLCSRKTPPQGAAKLVAEWLLLAERPLRVAIDQGSKAALALLGSALKLEEATSERRAQVVALAVMLAAYEAATGTHSWRSPDSATARYLRYLEANGYELSDVERLACGEAGR